MYLLFAKKASAFNSWFENAEEDLTDPVRCNSVEEIEALQDQHELFRESLLQAEEDMRILRRLDRQIKSYHVSINPYVHLFDKTYFMWCHVIQIACLYEKKSYDFLPSYFLKFSGPNLCANKADI